MTFGTPVGEREAIAIVHAALDLGVNFIDTSPLYRESERRIGLALAESDRGNTPVSS